MDKSKTCSGVSELNGRCFVSFSACSFQSASGRHRSRKFQLPELSVEFNSNKLEEFISQSLSKKTWRDYLSTWQNWLNHKAKREGVNGDLDHLILLMLEHIDAQHSVAYVRKQLSGISFFLRLFGHVDVTKAAVVKQFLKGWHKVKFVADKRKPITLDLLHKLLLVSEVSEAVSASKLKQGGLHINDVQLVDNKLRVLIKKSKTDQLGKGTLLWIGSFEHSNLCPVKAYESFLAIRPNVDGSFFIYSDGLPLTKFQLEHVLKRCLQKLNMEPKAYKSHSFRIGAATQASLLGFGEGFIRRLGRWDSKRYRSYIRPNLIDKC
ncbi:hypothetical protein XELAEV_18015928mg [Xenopus laevis]|uniref:Tyr recombinase domain-containing protein n=1 Tax=Xenopus laevis TaxID=8355 RepID=A0A974DLE8_XENLA|nr:hypothetical protein XELAEV_18015928mg [Xenopus laevis]